MASPGNYGLKDQALAIKWVHENIVNFGGDPSKITLMGHSAGAASVHMHMLSNTTREYFSRAVSLSGTAFNSWAVQPPKLIKDRLTRLSKRTRCRLTGRNGTVNFMNCIRRMNPYILVGQQRWIRVKTMRA